MRPCVITCTHATRNHVKTISNKKHIEMALTFYCNSASLLVAIGGLVGDGCLHLMIVEEQYVFLLVPRAIVARWYGGTRRG